MTRTNVCSKIYLAPENIETFSIGGDSIVTNMDSYIKKLSNYDCFGRFDKFPAATSIYENFDIKEMTQNIMFYTGDIDSPTCSVYIHIPDIEDIIFTDREEICDIINFVCTGYCLQLYARKMVNPAEAC